MHQLGREDLDIGRLLDVPIELTVELGRHQMPLEDALDLRPGSFVPANRLADEPVEVHVAGRVVAYGQMVVIDEELGIRVTEMAGGRALGAQEPGRTAELPGL